MVKQVPTTDSRQLFMDLISVNSNKHLLHNQHSLKAQPQAAATETMVATTAGLPQALAQEEQEEQAAQAVQEEEEEAHLEGHLPTGSSLRQSTPSTQGRLEARQCLKCGRRTTTYLPSSRVNGQAQSRQ